ncbi:MAG: hypothetical protein ACKVP7_25280 [Hyphomicrobiaceae bacterium]
MLPRIVLLVLQIAIAWIGGAWIAVPIIRALGIGRDFTIFVYAVVYAVLVWLVGLAGSAVLKGLRGPSTATLVFSLVLALVVAGLMQIDPVRLAVASVISAQQVPLLYYPLLGAVLGYVMKR